MNLVVFRYAVYNESHIILFQDILDTTRSHGTMASMPPIPSATPQSQIFPVSYLEGREFQSTSPQFPLVPSTWLRALLTMI